jgi:Sec-independent protein translocase protein TatA
MAGKQSLSARPSIKWEPLFENLEARFRSALLDVDFPMEECHEICVRCDTVADEEPDMDGIDVSIPHMLNSLGKGLGAFLRAFPDGEAATSSSASDKKKVKPRGIAQKKKLQKQKQQQNPRFAHAVEVLRSAHHLHDKLGAYHLSCLYASPAFFDESVSAFHGCLSML